MLRQHRLPAARGYQAGDKALNALATRLRRLAVHGGYRRREVLSPMLKQLLPVKRLEGSPAVQIAALRTRLERADLDDDAVAYLMATAETELEDARLRLV